LAKRRGHRILIDRGPGHLGEQGMKHHVIFAIEHHDFTVVSRQSFAQGFGAGDPGKSPTDNHDSLWWHEVKAPRST